MMPIFHLHPSSLKELQLNMMLPCLPSNQREAENLLQSLTRVLQ